MVKTKIGITRTTKETPQYSQTSNDKITLSVPVENKFVPVCKDIPYLSAQTGTIFFLIAFVWHIRVLPFVYDIVGREWAAVIALHTTHVEAFQPDLDLKNPDTIRDFALIGSLTHTIVFLFGLICAKVLRRFRLFYYIRTQGRVEPMGVGASILLVFWSGTFFHALAWKVLKYCFETRFGPVFRFAKVFFNENNGQSPFAWSSSVSYTIALLFGFLISFEEHSNRFQNVVLLGSTTLKRWVAWILIPFLAWISTLDRVTLPLYEALYNSIDITETTEAVIDSDKNVIIQTHQNNGSTPMEVLKRESHSVAFLIGLILCTVVPTLHTLYQFFNTSGQTQPNNSIKKVVSSG